MSGTEPNPAYVFFEKAAAPPFHGYCINCAYCQQKGHVAVPVGAAGFVQRPSDAWLCTQNAVSRDPVSGLGEGPDMVRCVFARKDTGRCGPEGRLFKKA